MAASQESQWWPVRSQETQLQFEAAVEGALDPPGGREPYEREGRLDASGLTSECGTLAGHRLVAFVLCMAWPLVSLVSPDRVQ